MILIRIKNKICRFIKNIYYLSKLNLKDMQNETRNMLNDLQSMQNETRNMLNETRNELKSLTYFLKIYLYYNIEHPELKDKYLIELDSISISTKTYLFANFPYKQLRTIENKIISGFNKENNMSYVIHDGKYLYFSKDINELCAVDVYKNYIQGEELIYDLGSSKYREKSPHQYETEDFYVRDGDVLVDLGAMEGLFALHHIEKVKKVFIVESDPNWVKALQATFEPYKHKVTIINKIVSDSDSDNTITLETLLYGAGGGGRIHYL